MGNSNDLTIRFIEVYDYLLRAKRVSSVSDFAKKIGISSSMMTEISKFRSNVGIKAIQNAVNTFPIVDSEWLLTGKGKMATFKTPSNQRVLNDLEEEYAIKIHGIPLIPIDAMAGWGTGSSQIMEYEVDRYIVPEFEELDVDFMIRVRNDSMFPKYSSGDIVACKKLPIGTFFQWNKVYVLDTIQGALIKRVKKSKKDNHILCVSENEEYEPFDLNMEEVNSLGLVVGFIGFD
jgi:phage repressor protein C with HTH and peptisase S24 domain